MKKLLAVLLVLGMGSMASAALQLSVNGQPAPDSITIAVSTTIMIDVTIEAGRNETIYVDVGARGGQYELGTVVGGPAQGDSGLKFITQWYDYQGYDETAIGMAWDPGTTNRPGGKVAEFPFHCTMAGMDVVVILYDFGGSTEVDRLTIHQVPEPMTMGLLGLGGLLLARRRRA